MTFLILHFDFDFLSDFLCCVVSCAGVPSPFKTFSFTNGLLYTRQGIHNYHLSLLLFRLAFFYRSPPF